VDNVAAEAQRLAAFLGLQSRPSAVALRILLAMILFVGYLRPPLNREGWHGQKASK
jgi:hypothetical protein